MKYAWGFLILCVVGSAIVLGQSYTAPPSAGSVAWSSITGMPAGFADGTDDGGGLTEPFSIGQAHIQTNLYASRLLVTNWSTYSGPSTNKDRVWLEERINQVDPTLAATFGQLRGQTLLITNDVIRPLKVPGLNAGNEFLWNLGANYGTNIAANNFFVVPTSLVSDVIYRLTIKSVGGVTTVSNSAALMMLNGGSFPGVSTNGTTHLFVQKDSVTGFTNCWIVGPQFSIVAAGQITLHTNPLTLTVTASNAVTTGSGAGVLSNAPIISSATLFNALADLLKAGQVDVRTNLYAAMAAVTNTLTASNVVATGGGTNTFAPTRVTNALDVVIVPQGTNVAVGGNIWFTVTPVANPTSNGTAAATVTIPIAAHTMTNNGDSVSFLFSGTMPAAQANTNQFTLVANNGGPDVTLLDSGMQISSNTTYKVEATLTRTGNTAHHVDATLTWGPGGAVPFVLTNANFVTTTTTNGLTLSVILKSTARRQGSHTNMVARATFDPATR